MSFKKIFRHAITTGLALSCGICLNACQFDSDRALNQIVSVDPFGTGTSPERGEIEIAFRLPKDLPAFQTQAIPKETDAFELHVTYPDGRAVKQRNNQDYPPQWIRLNEPWNVFSRLLVRTGAADTGFIHIGKTLGDLPVGETLLLKVRALQGDEVLTQGETQFTVQSQRERAGRMQVVRVVLEKLVEINEFKRGNIAVSNSFCSDGEVKVVVTLLDDSGQVITSGISAADFSATLQMPANSTARVQGIEIVREGQTIDYGGITDLVVMLDSSESMFGTKMMQAKAAARELINAHNGRVALYSFEGQLLNFTADKTLLNNALDQISVRGDTPLYRTLQNILSDIGSGGTVVLLTDGAATDRFLEGEVQRQTQNNGTTVYAVGLGSTFNHFPLQELARQTGGAYSMADVSNLINVFKGIGEVIAGSAILTLGIQPATPDTQYQGIIAATNRGNRLTSSLTFRSPTANLCQINATTQSNHQEGETN